MTILHLCPCRCQIYVYRITTCKYFTTINQSYNMTSLRQSKIEPFAWIVECTLWTPFVANILSRKHNEPIWFSLMILCRFVRCLSMNASYARCALSAFISISQHKISCLVGKLFSSSNSCTCSNVVTVEVGTFVVAEVMLNKIATNTISTIQQEQALYRWLSAQERRWAPRNPRPPRLVNLNMINHHQMLQYEN